MKNVCRLFSYSKCVPNGQKSKSLPSNVKEYTCECQVGFMIDKVLGICVDIDECGFTSNPCTKLGPDSRCTNLPGTYQCSCSMGFEYNPSTKKCEDIDECELSWLYRSHFFKNYENPYHYQNFDKNFQLS